MEFIKQADEYIAPTLTVLGTVTEVTLGTAGNDEADDTQYWK
ncbi:lasso RiPP family leader peptide-containing protein [Streptomyces sp. NPDC021100]